MVAVGAGVGVVQDSIFVIQILKVPLWIPKCFSLEAFQDVLSKLLTTCKKTVLVFFEVFGLLQWLF